MNAQIPDAPLQDTPPPKATQTHLATPHLILAALGVAVSIYAIWAHHRVEVGLSTGCGISETISCDAVLGSKWGKFAGIPLGYFGVIFWAIVAVTAISSAGADLKIAALQRLGVATVGIVFSAGLFYIAEFVIGKTCPICLSTHTLSLINFVYAVVGWRRVVQKLRLVSE